MIGRDEVIEFASFGVWRLVFLQIRFGDSLESEAVILSALS